MKPNAGLGPAGRFAQAWISSPLTPLIIAGALLIGGFAVWKLPREEEPQIIVPMIDVFVQMPGASAREVEERVTRPMEKLLWPDFRTWRHRCRRIPLFSAEAPQRSALHFEWN
jgi:hypothetical protein